MIYVEILTVKYPCSHCATNDKEGIVGFNVSLDTL